MLLSLLWVLVLAMVVVFSVLCWHCVVLASFHVVTTQNDLSAKAAGHSPARGASGKGARSQHHNNNRDYNAHVARKGIALSFSSPGYGNLIAKSPPEPPSLNHML